MIPAKEVGGDFYDFFFIDNERLGFFIGDVSGKGVPAALFMAVSRTFLKATALTGLSPRDCMDRINRSLFRESVPEVFMEAIRLHPIAVDVAVMLAFSVAFLVPAIWLFSRQD